MTRPVFAVALFAALSSFPSAAAPIPNVPPDPLPKGATARLGSQQFRGPDTRTLTFSSDGKHLYGGWSSQLQTWGVKTGRSLPPRNLTPRNIDRLSGSHTIVNDRLVRIGSPDRSSDWVVAVMRLEDGKELVRFTVQGSPFFESAHYLGHLVPMAQAAVTADGRYLAVASNDKVTVFDLGTGIELHSLRITRPTGVYGSPDGKTLLVREAGKPLRRFELTKGKEQPPLQGSEDADRVEVSPDGKWAVIREARSEKDEKGMVRLQSDDVLVVWDLATSKASTALEVGGIPLHFKCVEPDSVIVLTLKNRPPRSPVYTLSRWTISGGKREWEVPSPAASWLAVSPDGKSLAITDQEQMIHLYEVATGKPAATPLGHTGWVSWVEFSRDGGRVCTAGGAEIVTWTPNGEQKGVQTPPELRKGRIRPSVLGDRLVWVGFDSDRNATELVGWDQEKARFSWRMALKGAAPERIFSHDGNRVVCIGRDMKQKVWKSSVFDGPAGEMLHTWAVPDPLNLVGRFGIDESRVPPPLTLSGDGKLLFLGEEGVVGLDVATGKEKVRVDIGPVAVAAGGLVLSLAASPDGERIAVENDIAVRVYDVKTNKKLTEYKLGRLYDPGMRFSPNGKRLAVWDSGDVVFVCDTESNQADPRSFKVPEARVSSVAFSPNNASLIVGYRDGTALIWDLTTK